MASVQTRQEVFRKLRTDAENLYCFDCRCESPDYASVSHGIFLCGNCANHHRSFGVHISFVKNTEEDSWTTKQLKIMSAGGNSAFKVYISRYPFPPGDVSQIYKSNAAKFYRNMIKLLAEGSEWLDIDCTPELGVQEYKEPAPLSIPQPATEPQSWRSYWTAAVSSTKHLGTELADKANQLIAHPKMEQIKGKTKAVFQVLESKGKEIADNPKVQAMTQSASDYFSAAKSKANDTYHKIAEDPRVQSTKADLLGKWTSLSDKAAETLHQWRRGESEAVEPQSREASINPS